MNVWAQSKSLPVVSIRCGVHTGNVLVGNMGFATRMKYGIVGEDAHIPQILEETNKTYGTNMLISSTTYAALEAGSFIIRPIDFLKLRKHGEPELVYQVMEREKRHRKEHQLWPAAALYADALENYREQEFHTAMELFEKAGDMIAKISGHPDKASEVMIKRCQEYMDNPPPPDWDGV